MTKGKLVFMGGTLFAMLVGLNGILLFQNGIMWQQVSGIDLIWRMSGFELFLLTFMSMPVGLLFFAAYGTGWRRLSFLLGEVGGALVGFIVGSLITVSSAGFMYSFKIGLYEGGFAIIGHLVSIGIAEKLLKYDRY